MKKLSLIFLTILLSSVILFSGFKGVNENQVSNIPVPPNEFEVLLNFLETIRNFINSPDAPALIPASEVKQNIKNEKYHIIDIRSESWFEYGHMKNANNVQPADLLTYFETNIAPADYDKIVLVCYSGQSAAYYTGLLRIAGYDNTYSMNWGMSSWRVDFAENSWLKNTSSDYGQKLETTNNAKAANGSLPMLATGQSEAEAILRTRLETAFATPYKESIVKSTDAFANPGNYYIIDYNAEDRYSKGHIPHAIQYQPNGSLTSTADLYTLPTDKQVLVYGATGQETAYVVAYLNILGYKAGNLAYGSNSFMHKTLKDNGWEAFTKKSVNMYPVVE